MNKVITINLNGKAYQLEEDGYTALQNYLRQAEEKLNDDPDKKEVMGDLEQALAEKLDRFLKPHKTVIIKQEAEEVIKEMGPVEGQEKQKSDDNKNQTEQPSGAKRLYRVREGSMIAGVCTGLAAYFNVDVTVVRIIFVILGLLTHGFWIAAYFIMVLVIPHAETSAQKAAAFGLPFTAQEFVNRARSEYQKFADSGQWQKWKYEMKQKAREEKRQWKEQRRAQRMQNNPSYFSPFLGLLTAVLSLLWILGLISLVTKGMVLGVTIPVGVPLWIAILAWLCLYGFIMSPLRPFRYRYNYPYAGVNGHHYHHDGFLETITWFAFFAVLGWALWHYVPASHMYFAKTKQWLNHILAHFKKR